jgi:hypothetical protein
MIWAVTSVWLSLRLKLTFLPRRSSNVLMSPRARTWSSELYSLVMYWTLCSMFA